MPRALFFVLDETGQFVRIGGLTEPFPLFQQMESAVELARQTSEFYPDKKFTVCQTLGTATDGSIDWAGLADTDTAPEAA